ncbi:ABC transporter substrate-binding protein [Paenibacillus harenae]|uniref:ABC transporter substrate-binding protein n=1 Tax=Paenibacillus harenae TaxID=306543 RepID=UPI0003FC3D66|nr:extracellular solute-binding protein [Paenibacillus harenae]
MRGMRRLGLFTLAFVMIAVMLAACSGGNANETNNGNTGANTGTDTGTNQEKEDSAPELKETELKMVLLGDTPTDLDAMLAELNKLLKQELNATIAIEYLPWSDWEQKYSLILSSGEPIDLIYTSDWAKYAQEATKGAFVEVTDDLLTKYMPLTKASQDPVSFEQGKINGKLYFVPKNSAAFNGEQAVLIRGDLREKYGLEPLASVDDLRAYLDAVAANEKGAGIIPYAASQDNESFRILMQEQEINMINVGPDYQYRWEDHDSLTIDKIEYKYDSTSYIAFAKEMKEWADKGFWTKNAISNKTQPRDAFENGTSATLIWNAGTVSASAAKVTADHPDWKPEVYDVIPNSIKRLGLYTADGMAVPANSKNQERAFMVLDYIKNTREAYEILQFGIKGKHWEPIDDMLWKEGPEYDRFGGGANGQWGFNNSAFKRTKEGAFPAEAELDAIWKTKVVHPKTETFVFDESNVKNEMAALATLRTKYRAMISLGMVADVEGTIKEWRSQADKAGLAKVEAELKSQLEAFLAKQ